MPTESNKSPSKNHKKLVFAIAAIIILLGIAGIIFVFLQQQSNEPEEFFDDLEPGMDDAALYQALLENGIEDAVVDFQEKQVLVSFELPNGNDEQNTAFFALGLAGGMAEPEQQVVVEIFFGNQSKTFSVKAETAQKLERNEISETEFEQNVKTT